MTVTVEGIVTACLGFLAVSAVLGIIARLVLVPYLRAVLVEPMVANYAQLADDVKEIRGEVGTIHHEVTPNGGGSIKDAVKRIESSQSDTREAIRRGDKRTHDRIDALTVRFDAHVDDK